MQGQSSGGAGRRLVRLGGVSIALTLGVAAVAAPAPSQVSRGYGYGYARPTPPPTVTASPSPPAAQPRFRFALRLVRGQTVRSLRRRGLRLRATCSASCLASVRVSISKRIARKLRIARTGKVIGRRSRVLSAAQPRTIVVRLSRKARRGLTRVRKARLQRVKLTVRGQAVDAAERRVRVTLGPRLRRR